MFENVFDIKNHLFPWTFSRKLRLKQLFRPQSYRMVQILPVGALNLQDWNLSLQVCPPHVVYTPNIHSHRIHDFRSIKKILYIIEILQVLKDRVADFEV